MKKKLTCNCFQIFHFEKKEGQNEKTPWSFLISGGGRGLWPGKEGGWLWWFSRCMEKSINITLVTDGKVDQSAGQNWTKGNFKWNATWNVNKFIHKVTWQGVWKHQAFTVGKYLVFQDNIQDKTKALSLHDNNTLSTSVPFHLSRFFLESRFSIWWPTTKRTYPLPKCRPSSSI